MSILLFKIKSFLGLTIAPFLFFLSLSQTGVLAYSFLLAIPAIALMDMLTPKSLLNPTKEEEEAMEIDKYYDVLAWIIAPGAVVCLIYYLIQIYTLHETTSLVTLIGWATAMGGVGGAWGIAIGHELGHRINSWEKYLGKILLFTSLRMTFLTFHNHGHHRHVGTPLDPSFADRNVSSYIHVPKSLFLTWIDAWKIQMKLLKARKASFFSIYNDVFWYTVIQWTAIIAVGIILNWQTALGFVCAGLTGSLLFELINYIEHYGLKRRQLANGRYERVLPLHSWNDAHTITGSILLNGVRHSDHHYMANRPYQILRNYEDIPTNLPINSTGMMVLALFPPLFFYIMNKRLDEIEAMRDKEENIKSQKVDQLVLAN
ncbi:MAG: alkane 1-monooxygenase [Maribacter sp.]|jgi:alkane 1-monooxygenase